MVATHADSAEVLCSSPARMRVTMFENGPNLAVLRQHREESVEDLVDEVAPPTQLAVGCSDATIDCLGRLLFGRGIDELEIAGVELSVEGTTAVPMNMPHDFFRIADGHRAELLELYPPASTGWTVAAHPSRSSAASRSTR